MGELSNYSEELIGERWTKVAKIFFAVIVLYLGFGLIFSFWPFSSAAKVVEKVTSADSIISNYQWFYDQKNAIDAQRANLLVIDKSAPEYSGMMMVLNNAIAEYNSRSKQITRNLWKAQDLPYSIPLEALK